MLSSRPLLPRIKSFAKGFGYLLSLVGASIGGFPPPRPFSRDLSPEAVLEQVVDRADIVDLDGWESEWGFRVDTRPPPHVRVPERS